MSMAWVFGLIHIQTGTTAVKERHRRASGNLKQEGEIQYIPLERYRPIHIRDGNRYLPCAVYLHLVPPFLSVI